MSLSGSRLFRYLTGILLLATGLLLVGCGGDGNESNANEPDGAAQQAPHGQTQPGERTPQQIQELFRAEGAGISQGTYRAPVDVFIFTNFQCQACKSLALEFMPYLRQNLIGPEKIEVTLFDYPHREEYPHSLMAHRAARCAGGTENFWAMHDLLFQNQAEWASQATEEPAQLFRQYVQQAVPNEDALRRWTQCMQSGLFRREILGNARLAQTLGVEQLPAVFVNYQRVRGGGQAILDAIQEELPEDTTQGDLPEGGDEGGG